VVRELVLASESDLTERVYLGWDGIGFRHPVAGYVCAIYPREKEQEVRLLFEHGARLEDPERLLEGDGAQTRFIRVREPTARCRPAEHRRSGTSLGKHVVGEVRHRTMSFSCSRLLHRLSSRSRGRADGRCPALDRRLVESEPRRPDLRVLVEDAKLTPCCDCSVNVTPYDEDQRPQRERGCGTWCATRPGKRQAATATLRTSCASAV
jgi:hypothetical protein